ncbi:glycosyltransferase family 4 protein [Schaalia vaccimaxillae]|uniref:glycosyltransferase family 4 protein n=1 Tax=Schaalia vaccimaxillae TaxID=183916 RepID=UPI0003B7AFAF|nr:glycosyltransferase family 4 protein [Schaalia vaccimaxillae]
MRIGIVNPYSWDIPGGVGYHIRDLALSLMGMGHYVNVLTPSTDDNLPEWVTSIGPYKSIPYNGSVANVSTDPRTVIVRTRAWLDEHDFDVVHVHEPAVPSASMAAVIWSKAPLVGTFHSAMDKSRARSLVSMPMRPYMERIAVRIAVSQEARRTLREHHGGDAVIIPNGVETTSFRNAQPVAQWQRTPDRPVFVFLGRLDESRKGLSVFAGAVSRVIAKVPGARFLVAGRGQADDIREELAQYGDAVEFLGEISDEDKESLLSGATAYVAPQRGGESFGIVLVEAMAAGCAVVASDIEAFQAVLEYGNVGKLFANGDSSQLAQILIDLVEDPIQRDNIALAGQIASRQYDWDVVTEKILATYRAAIDTGSPVLAGVRETLSSLFMREDGQ